MYEIRDDYELIFLNIKETVTQYLCENRALESLIVGISGGVDSALTTVLAHEILKDLSGVILVGRIIPIETNTGEETARAERIGRLFCHECKTEDLTDAFENLYGHIARDSRRKNPSREEKIRSGNIKARVRMIYLFDLAHFKRGMVLSTDNLTELMLGFWTLHGDVGNFGFLQYLWKSEVYGLARYFEGKYRKEGETQKADAIQRCIAAVPTDGLGITASDFEQIEVPDYKTADTILTRYFKNDLTHEDHPVIKRYRATQFKRLDPQNISREVLFSKKVNRPEF